jgi:serine/threonine-protein kinase/endoribonuclease IRE1
MNQSHPNIVHVYRLGELPGSSLYYFIDMELCDVTLENYIRFTLPSYSITDQGNPRLKVLRIWDIMRQIANGVAFIHSLQEVHRDLKPNNSTSM